MSVHWTLWTGTTLLLAMGRLIECDKKPPRDMTDAEISAIRQSLLELRAIPEAIRCCVPDDYDYEHPENFPPAPELEVSFMEKP
jgi:hypothetical protein